MDKYWEKVKSSFTLFRKSDNSCGCSLEATNVQNNENSCRCENDGEVDSLAPRLEGCNCGPGKKCQFDRAKTIECTCNPRQKENHGYICESNGRNTENKVQGRNCNSIDVEVPQTICNKCFCETHVSRVRDILGPAIDDSVVSCVNFMIGRGKDRRRNQTDMSSCPDTRSDRDLVSWIQSEYKELAQDVMKAKSQACPEGKLSKDMLQARHRVLNNLTELLGTKRELEHLEGANTRPKVNGCSRNSQRCLRIYPPAVIEGFLLIYLH